MTICPDTSTSIELAVGGTTAQFTGPTMGSGSYFLYMANVASWIAQGSNPTASAGAGSMYVPANTVVVLDGACGAKLAIINDGTAGKASLTRARRA